MKKLKNKIENRFFCYWCLTLDGKHRFGKHYGRYPVDVDADDEGGMQSLYGNINMCDKHYWCYENREGIYDADKYL